MSWPLFKKPKPQKITRITHLRYVYSSKEWSIRIEIGKEWFQTVIEWELAKFLLISYLEKGVLSKTEFDEREFILTLR